MSYKKIIMAVCFITLICFKNKLIGLLDRSSIHPEQTENIIPSTAGDNSKQHGSERNSSDKDTMLITGKALTMNSNNYIILN